MGLASEQAYRLVRADILSGDLPGGSRLGENQLAEKYGISRTPIRESLRRLQAEGLVEVEPNRGARVISWQDLNISNLYDLRASLESVIVRQATLLISDQVIGRLTELCDEMEHNARTLPQGSEDLLDQTTQLNYEFHGTIAGVIGGEMIAIMRRGVVLSPLVMRAVHEYTSEDQIRSNQHHREIIAAFRARSPEWASSVMLSHIYASKSRLLSSLVIREGQSSDDST